MGRSEVRHRPRHRHSHERLGDSGRGGRLCGACPDAARARGLRGLILSRPFVSRRAPPLRCSVRSRRRRMSSARPKTIRAIRNLVPAKGVPAEALKHIARAEAFVDSGVRHYRGRERMPSGVSRRLRADGREPADPDAQNAWASSSVQRDEPTRADIEAAVAEGLKQAFSDGAMIPPTPETSR